MENLIIKIKPEDIKVDNKISDNKIYNLIVNTIRDRIKNNELKFKDKYKESSFHREGPYVTLDNKENNIFRFIAISYKKDNSNYNIYKSMSFILKENVIVLNPYFFETDFSADKNSNNLIIKIYNENVISCVHSAEMFNQFNLLSPRESVLDIISSDKNDLFKLYLMDFLLLIIKEEFNINNNIYLDLIMPIEYKSRIEFIEKYLKIDRVNKNAFKNNNSSNNLIYYFKTINVYE